MRMLFFDSSALVKHYYKEKGSDVVHKLLRESDLMVVSSITTIEIISALARKMRNREINKPDYEVAKKGIYGDWKYFAVIRTEEPILTRAVRLIESHGLKAADAVQLSSALEAKSALLEEDIEPVLVTSDIELKEAGKAEGFTVIDPEEESSQ